MANSIRLVRKAEGVETPQEPQGPFYTKWFPKGDQKKTAISALIGVSACVILVCIFRWYIYSIYHVSTENAFIESELFPVNSRMMGFVKEVLVQENQKIKKGEVLVVFDDSDVKIELEYKEARFKKAEMDYNRGKRLIGTQALSRADFELAETNYTATHADLEGTRLKLQFTHITAQADGVIAKKSVNVGQFVQPGQSLFMVVSPADQMWVKANFKETQIQKIKVGQKVAVKVDAYPSEEWEGEVAGIFPSSGSILSLLPPENATGNFTKIVQRIPVKIKLKHKSDFELKSGMSAHVMVLTK